MLHRPSFRTSLILLAITLSAGCTERRAERAFRTAVTMEETHPLPEVRDALQDIVKHYPKTKAAGRARQELEWIDDILSAAARGPLLRAWDAIRQVSMAVERFRVREKRLPEALEELVPRELADVVHDPWGVPIRFSKRGNGYVVVCYGADGLPGGGGNNTDFVIENGKFVYGGLR